MGATSTITYTCDNDGVVSAPSTTGLPEGWTMATVTSQTTPPPTPPPGDASQATAGVAPPPTMTAQVVLCPACSPQFQTALAAFSKKK